MNAEAFGSLPLAELAEVVRAHGPVVCVFPINGTRRWYLLEYGHQRGDAYAHYIAVAERRHIELYRMFFDHGVDTLLTPIFGPDLLERGDDYVRLAMDGLARLATHPDFLDFYEAHQVRVRFYGDHRRYLSATPYAHIPDLFDEVTARTQHHQRHRLFFGVFAHDAAQTTGELAIRYYLQVGRAPDTQALIALYYGEPVPPVSLFIGFDKFSAFDMPLIATGSEDLYFTVSPSPYLDTAQLRAILYDHLFARRGDEPDYLAMDPEEWVAMRAFYDANGGSTCGIGMRRSPGGWWYPLPQVRLPQGFDNP